MFTAHLSAISELAGQQHQRIGKLRGTFTNDPRTAALNDNFVAINSAVNVDLTGQICAESIGSCQYSSSGGQFDMSYGAVHARGGRCQFICCLHWMR